MTKRVSRADIVVVCWGGNDLSATGKGGGFCYPYRQAEAVLNKQIWDEVRRLMILLRSFSRAVFVTGLSVLLRTRQPVEQWRSTTWPSSTT